MGRVREQVTLHLQHRAAVLEHQLEQNRVRAGAAMASQVASKNGLVSLANWPEAGMLLSVPTAPGSPSCSQLLRSMDKSLTGWNAPVGVRSVELFVALARLSNVSSIWLDPGARYAVGHDCPTVSVAAGMYLGELVPVQVTVIRIT